MQTVKNTIPAIAEAMEKLHDLARRISAELDEALKKYAELKEKAVGMDAAELMGARFAVREEKE